MSKIFVTDRKNVGLEVIAGKYQFINGVFTPDNDDDFAKIEPLLTRFYGVTVEDNDRNEYEKAKEDFDPVLLALQTKAASESGNAMSTEAAIAAGEAAGDPNVTGTFSEPTTTRNPETPSDGGTGDPKVLAPSSSPAGTSDGSDDDSEEK